MRGLASAAALMLLMGVAGTVPASAAPGPLLEGSWTCTGKLVNGAEQQMIIFGADTSQQAVEQARQTYSGWSQISCVPQ